VTAVLALGDPLPPTAEGSGGDAGAEGGIGEGGSGEIPGLGEKGYRALVDDFERALVRAALERSQGNVAAAARLLKVDRGNLYRRIQALDMVGADVPETSRPPER
jgi:DNA-binding NtrC family response regulator